METFNCSHKHKSTNPPRKNGSFIIKSILLLTVINNAQQGQCRQQVSYKDAEGHNCASCTSLQWWWEELVDHSCIFQEPLQVHCVPHRHPLVEAVPQLSLFSSLFFLNLILPCRDYEAPTLMLFFSTTCIVTFLYLSHHTVQEVSFNSITHTPARNILKYTWLIFLATKSNKELISKMFV